MNPVSAVIVDIEGTLLPPKGKATDPYQVLRVRRYVDLASQGKVPQLAVATGRNSSYVEDLLRHLGLPSAFPHIVENGAALYYADSDTLYEHPGTERFQELRPEIMASVQRIMSEIGCYFDLQKQFMITIYPHASGLSGSAKDLYELFVDELADYASFIDISYSSSAIDITPKGVNKGSAFSNWLETTGVEDQNVLMIGDSHNDLPLITRAGFAACPGNADRQVMEAIWKHGDNGFVAYGHDTAGVIETLMHFFEVDLPDPRLTKLSTVVALRQKSGVMCAKIPAANIEEGNGVIHVTIPDNPQIAIDREGYRSLQEPSHGAFMRWGAGGLAPILNTKSGKFLVTLYRDKEAISWPNTLTIPTGVTADETEFVDILHAMIREGLEEVLIKTPKGLAVPIAPILSDQAILIAPMQQILAQRYWANIHGRDPIPARFVDLPDEKILHISWENQKSTLSCIVTVHLETNGIDCVKVVEYDLPYTIEDIALADGEESETGLPLNRSIYLISLEEIRRWVKNGGDIFPSYAFFGGVMIHPKNDLKGIQPLPFLRDVMQALAK